ECRLSSAAPLPRLHEEALPRIGRTIRITAGGAGVRRALWLLLRAQQDHLRRRPDLRASPARAGWTTNAHKDGGADLATQSATARCALSDHPTASTRNMGR